MSLTITSEVIKNIWKTIESDLNAQQIVISSEKTLVFKFAWLLNTIDDFKVYNIDFEKNLFRRDFKDGKFLDLYFEVEIESIKHRVGIEFKFPHKKKSNSGQTQNIQKIINDLKKLDSLFQDDKIDLGVFLCATNEPYYLNIKKKTRKIKGSFKTFNGKKYLKDTEYPYNEKYKHRLKISNDIIFNWRNTDKISESYFSFLDPIFIRNDIENEKMKLNENL
ncbi:hypothetical protein [Winogradskyella poriferorum]|uniref:Restriction endonuclease n=1 Tax=Winogradskyella poriferorum TaxID=307627 RepID=A0ABU7W0A8_9FLAO